MDDTASERKTGRTLGIRCRVPSVRVTMCMLVCASICVSIALPAHYPLPAHMQQASAYEAVELSVHAGAESASTARHGEIHLMELTIMDANTPMQLALRKGNVADALKEADITLGPLDEVSVSVDQPVYHGMSFSVVRVQKEKILETEDVPYKTVRRANASLPIGSSKVLQEGRSGQRRVLYELLYRNGSEQARTMLESTDLSAAVDKIVEYGTRLPEGKLGSGPNELSFEDGSTVKYTKALNVVATAYSCENSSDNITATGSIARVGAIAVDPRVIPLGSRMYITAADGSWIYGYAVAEDTGGFIKGNRIDLYFDTVAECIQFGRKRAIVYILD